MSTSRYQTERGHEMPFIRQFSVFMPNRVGRLGELLEGLGEAEVDLAGLSVVESTDWAVVRMIFTDTGKAREILTRQGASFTESEVLAVVLEEAGTLNRALKALVAAELNVDYAYSLLIRRDDSPVLALHVDDHVLAVQLLTKHGFTLVDHEDI